MPSSNLESELVWFNVPGVVLGCAGLSLWLDPAGCEPNPILEGGTWPNGDVLSPELPKPPKPPEEATGVGLANNEVEPP